MNTCPWGKKKLSESGPEWPWTARGLFVANKGLKADDWLSYVKLNESTNLKIGATVVGWDVEQRMPLGKLKPRTIDILRKWSQLLGFLETDYKISRIQNLQAKHYRQPINLSAIIKQSQMCSVTSLITTTTPNINNSIWERNTLSDLPAKVNPNNHQFHLNFTKYKKALGILNSFDTSKVTI